MAPEADCGKGARLRAKHPRAVDNVWDVKQFWLGDPDMDLSLVECALQSLAADGFIGTRDEPLMLGGRVWFALPAAR